jgi:hypothetical protein
LFAEDATREHFWPTFFTWSCSNGIMRWLAVPNWIEPFITDPEIIKMIWTTSEDDATTVKFVTWYHL